MHENEQRTVESMTVNEALSKNIYASTDVAFDCGGRGNLHSSIVSIGILVL